MSELKSELREDHFLAINYMFCYGNERLLDTRIFGFLTRGTFVDCCDLSLLKSA